VELALGSEKTEELALGDPANAPEEGLIAKQMTEAKELANGTVIHGKLAFGGFD
jgi:hypothetical protein